MAGRSRRCSAQHPDREPDATPLVDRDARAGPAGQRAAPVARATACRSWSPCSAAPASARAGWCASCSSTPTGSSTQPVTWRTGRCPPFGENVTYAALADIVKAQAGILDTDTRRHRPAQRLDDRRSPSWSAPAEAGRLTDALGPLVGLPGAEAAAEEAESAWRRFLVALAARPPDRAGLRGPALGRRDDAALRRAARRVRPRRAAAAAVHRPAGAGRARPELGRHDHRLADDHAAAAARHRRSRRSTRTCSARPRSPPTCSSPLVELADGNPLYAHEYVRMLIEQGALRQSGRGWSLEQRPSCRCRTACTRSSPTGSTCSTPPTARCCWPPPWWACSSGRARSPPRWAGRSSRSSGRCAGWSSATSCTSSRSSTMAGQPEYRFRHVLVRDVCYQRLPRTERVARHERTADWLDALSRSRRHRPRRGAGPPPVGRARDRPHARRRRRPLRAGRPRRAAPGRPAGVRPARPRRRRRRTPAGPLALRRRPTDDRSTGCARAARHRDLVLPRRRRVPRRRRRRPADRAGRAALRRRRPRPARPAPGRCSARPPGCAPTGAAALSCLDRAVELFDDLPDTAGEGRRVRRAGPAAHAQLRARPGDRGGRRGGGDRRRGSAWSRCRPTPGSPSAPPATRPATGPAWTSCRP